MQTTRFLQADNLELHPQESLWSFPLTFTICMIPGVLFVPFCLERYQNLIIQKKNKVQDGLNRFFPIKWVCYIIMCLDVLIWIYTIENPIVMRLENSQLNVTVLYLFLLLCWYLSQVIEIQEQCLNLSDSSKIQNNFWIFSFFINTLQLVLFANVNFSLFLTFSSALNFGYSSFLKSASISFLLPKHFLAERK